MKLPKKEVAFTPLPFICTEPLLLTNAVSIKLLLYPGDDARVFPQIF